MTFPAKEGLSKMADSISSLWEGKRSPEESAEASAALEQVRQKKSIKDNEYRLPPWMGTSQSPEKQPSHGIGEKNLRAPLRQKNEPELTTTKQLTIEKSTKRSTKAAPVDELMEFEALRNQEYHVSRAPWDYNLAKEKKSAQSISELSNPKRHIVKKRKQAMKNRQKNPNPSKKKNLQKKISWKVLKPSSRNKFKVLEKALKETTEIPTRNLIAPMPEVKLSIQRTVLKRRRRPKAKRRNTRNY